MKYIKVGLKIIPTSLVIGLVGIILAFYTSFSADSRFFTVIEQYKQDFSYDNIHSSYSNLGTIIIHFQKPILEDGFFTFRLQEIGEAQAIYEAKYALRDVYYLPQYPFGFSIITSSKDKNYQISIDSQNLVLQKTGIKFELLYPFNKSELLQGKNMGEFLWGKMLQYTSILIDSNNMVFFITPALLYFCISIIRFILKNRFEKNEIYLQIAELMKPSFLALIIFIGYDILFIQKSSDFRIITVCLLWATLIYSYRYTPQKSFVGALLFLTLCPLLVFANMVYIAEKSAIWAYMYLVMGTIHAVIELKRDGKKGGKLEDRAHLFLNQISYFDSKIITLYKKYIIKKPTPTIHLVTFKEKMSYLTKKAREFVLFIFYITFVTILLLTITTIYIKTKSAHDRSLRNPQVEIIEPSLVYPGTKVIIYGDSFSGKEDSRNKLMKDGVEVRTDYWEDHKIIFTVPLSWKSGMMNFWIEKPIEWNGETIIEKTKPVPVKLLKVTGKFTPDDDLYFEQVKQWKKETREINGYK